MFDVQVCNAIESLIEKLSTTGKDELDMKKLKDLFVLAGKSEHYLQFFRDKLLLQLEKQHAEIRIGVLLIIDNIVHRSPVFRDLLLDVLETYFELVFGTNKKKPLPPPKSAATKLKQNALMTFQNWYMKYRQEDVRFEIARRFIQNCEKIDPEISIKKTADRIAKSKEREERKAKIAKSRIAALRIEVDDNAEEISRVITEIDSCCGLLVPSPHNFLHGGTPNDSGENTNVNLREHGLGGDSSSTVSITVHIEPSGTVKIHEDEDNVALIETLKDLYTLCKNRLLPRTRQWVKMVSREEDEALFKRVVDMKKMIQSEMSRIEKLEVGPSFTVLQYDSVTGSSSSDDSDFEEVADKVGYEEVCAEPSARSKSSTSHTVTSSDVSGSVAEIGTNNDLEDPATVVANVEKIINSRKPSSTVTGAENGDSQKSKPEPEVGCSSANADLNQTSETVPGDSPAPKVLSRKEKLLGVAPKLPFDIDLIYWTDGNLKAPTVEITECSSHRFWKPADREGTVIEAQDGVASLRTRKIEFSGNFEPVKWSCRAPLKSGKLCSRMDRLKCPFHGKVIARDEQGNPTQPEDIAKLEAEKEREEREKPPDWQDPAYLKELKAETGIDLTIRKPTRGRKKTFAEMYPALTEIEKKNKTARDRLARKIFNKSSMKKIAHQEDNMSYNRFRDKYADQFNYAYNT